MSGGGKNPLMALSLRILVAGYLAYLGLQIWPEKVWAILKFKRDGGSEGGEE